MIKRIAQYEIQADLGRGAFTRVLQGFDPALGRKVALKIPAQDDDRELFTGLLKEAAAAANLHHPNIVTIYEWGHDKGLPFIAVEYLQGQTLRRAIASHKPLTLLQKILIMSQIGNALHCAHQSGAVHLDIRPINVMLLDDASIKLMDFGAAELTPEKAEWLRDKGYLDESIPYAAPEQLTGSDAPPTLSDVFAYGVMYYELLTGRHPFHAARISDVISKIINETPASVRDLAPECPESLGRILSHTLAKDPHQRFESIAGIQAAVAPILLDLKKAQAAPPPQPEQPPSPPQPKPKDAAPPKTADVEQPRARAAKAQHERRQRLKAELGAVRQMIKAGRLDDAIRRLATLRIEFPEEKAVNDLLREAQPEPVKPPQPAEPPPEESPPKAEKSPVPRWRWEIAAAALIIAGAGVGFRSKDLLGHRAAATAAPPAAIAAPVGQPVDPTPPLVTQPAHPVADPPPIVIEGPATIIAAPAPKPEPPPRAAWTAPASTPRTASQPAPVIAETPSIAAAAPVTSLSLPSSAAVGPVAAPPPPAPPPTPTPAKPLPYSAPRPIRQVPPTMPDNMKRAFTGEIVVSVRVDVDASGNVVNAVPLKKGDRIADYLAGLAVNAARRWQFEPARRGPNPVPGEAVVNFTFQGTR